MPKIHPLRLILRRAQKAYDLGATPEPPSIYRQAPPKPGESQPEDNLPTNRMALLQHGIDVKTTINKALFVIEKLHGTRRAERVVEWLSGGYVSRYSYRHAAMLREDIELIQRRLRRG